MPIEQAAPGATVVVDGKPNWRVVVHGYQFTVGQQGTVRFKSSGGTAHTGAMDFEARGGICAQPSEVAYFVCKTGEDLIVETVGGPANGTVQFKWE